MLKMTKNYKSKNKALFLDRDGVVNIDYGHVYQIKKFHLIENIYTLVKEANNKKYKVIIITNQAGIGKQLYSNNDFQKLTSYMKTLFLKENCHIDAVYNCPYNPKEGVGKYLMDSFERKPNPGMLLKAINKWNININDSFFIGDSISDFNAAKKIRIKFYYKKH